MIKTRNFSQGSPDYQPQSNISRYASLLPTVVSLAWPTILEQMMQTAVQYIDTAMVGIFSRDPEVIALGSRVLRMVACSEPFYGVSIVTEGMLQGAGKTFYPSIFNIAGMWGIRIAGTFVCTQLLGLGLTAAWGCMICHNLFLWLMFRIYVRRLYPDQ